MIELKAVLLVNNKSQTTSIKQCIVKPTRAIQSLFGTRQYYSFRYWDFRWRHVGCSHIAPPEYYYGPTINGKPDFSKSYGYKYCAKFEDETYKELSDKGKIWLQKTKLNLQYYMENGLLRERYKSKNFPQVYKKYNIEGALVDIELDNDKFQDFAFATHPDAYLDAGLLDLGFNDLLCISSTPDTVEFLNIRTIKQVVLVGSELLKHCCLIPLTWTQEKAAEFLKEIKEYAEKEVEDIFRQMIPGIRELIKDAVIRRIKELIDKYR